MSRRRSDDALRWALLGSAVASGVLVLLIVGFLASESLPALSRMGVARFVADPSWHPRPVAAEGTFNLVPMLWGTVLATIGAVALAAPLGILSALFCHSFAGQRLRRAFRRMVAVLAGIPSVVYGLWGMVVLVPLIREVRTPGPSLAAGIVILAIMIVPTIALVADAAFENVPRHSLGAASALGLSRWATLRGVILPSARSGLLTGVLLGTGRALGETMAILMVAGNVVATPASVFDPIRTLTANIALEMAYALGDHRAALFVTALLLMLLVSALVLAADAVGGEGSHA